jgi:hypothetical protein
MSNPVHETQPEPEEVLQHEPDAVLDMGSVPVVVDGPVRVQSLPAMVWAVAQARPTDTLGAQQLLGANPNRKRAVLTSLQGGYYLAPTKAQAESRTSAARIGLSTPIEITHVGEVWVYNEAAETPAVSAIIEYWD